MYKVAVIHLSANYGPSGGMSDGLACTQVSVKEVWEDVAGEVTGVASVWLCSNVSNYIYHNRDSQCFWSMGRGP